MARFNPIGGTIFARWPWSLLVFGVGALGVELFMVGLLAVWTVMGIDLWSSTFWLPYFGATVFFVGSLTGQIWALVLSCAAVLGGVVGRQRGQASERWGVGIGSLVPVLALAVLSRGHIDFYSALFLASGGVAAAAYVALTYWYRAAPLDTELEARRKLAKKLDEREQRDA